MNRRHGLRRGTSRTAAARVLLLLTCLLPLVYMPEMLYPYITPKGLFFQVTIGTCAVTAFWVGANRKIRVEDSSDPILLSLAVFVGVTVLSAIVAPATRESFVGNYERMWGVAQWLSLFFFYVLLRAFYAEQDWNVFLRCTIYAAVGVALYAGIDYYLSSVVTSTSRADGTLGNPSYLGVYLILAIGVAALVVRQTTTTWSRAAVGAAILLILGGVLVSGSRSSLIGIAAGAGGALILAVTAVTQRTVIDRRWVYGGVAGILVVVGVALLALPELAGRIPAVARLSEAGVGSTNLLKRFEMWEAALEGARRRPLTGWGVDQFPLVFDRFVDPAAYRLGSVRADRVHNVLLGKLVHSGVLGLLAYLAIWSILVLQTIRGWWEGELQSWEAAAFLAAFVGYFVYLQMWFEDHSSAALLIALAAYLRYRCTGGDNLVRVEGKKDRSWGKLVVSTVVSIGVLGLVLWYLGGLAGGAHQLYRATVSSDLDGRITHFERARQLGVFRHQEVASRYALSMGRIGQAAADVLQRSDSLRAIYRRGVGGAEQALNQAVVQNPLSGRLDQARGRLAVGAGIVYQDQDIRSVARESLIEAIEKSPPILVYRHQLAIMHSLFGERDSARKALHDALEVYDGYGRTYYLMSQVSKGELDEIDLRHLREAFWLGYQPDDRSELWLVVDELLKSGRPDRAEELLTVYFASHYLPALRTTADPYRQGRKSFFGTLDADVAPPGMEYRSYQIASGDLPLLARWPRAAMEAGQCRRAALAVGLLMNGLSRSSGTARIRPTLARQLADMNGRCDG